MNIEKQITLTELKGKFTKDFDTFNKMDVFLELSVGKCTARTETAQEMGKEPIWKDPIQLNYFDQSHITIKAYDQDTTDNQYMGMGKLQIKSLRIPGGVIEVAINGENGENIGTITGKYTLKNLTQSPLLMLKNFKLELLKENKQFSKAKPFLQVTADQATVATEAKEEAVGTTLVWTEVLRLKIKDSSKLAISLIDKEDSSSNIFTYECSARQFRLQNGTRKFNVLDQSYNPLGQLILDFETIGLVSKEESVKNSEKEKKAQSQLTAITLERITSELPKEIVDVYYKFIVGNNTHTTEVIKQATQASTLDINQTLYAQSKENKLIVAVCEKGSLTDTTIGVGKVMLDSLSSGEKKINLENSQTNQQVGSITLNLNVKQTPCKSIYLDNISIQISEEGDIIGTPEPYFVAKVGCCSGRTETGSQIKATYKKAIQLKFGNQENIILQIWDEDVGSSVLMFSESVPLNSFKSLKGEHSVSLTRQQSEKPEAAKGKASFRYQLKGIVLESPRKPSQKKIQTNRSSKQPSLKQELGKKQIITAREKSQAEEESSRDKKYSIASKEAELISHRVEKQHSLNKDSLSKSKETLNLPSIMSSFHQVYGDRIFNKQSAATLQRSILVYSMPKANRFANEPKYSGEPSYCVDSCFKPNPSKGVGFGYGKKKQFPEWMERNMKENPAPGSYFESQYEFRSRGPTFGLGHKYYQRVMIPREEKQQQHTLTRKLSPIRDPVKK